MNYSPNSENPHTVYDLVQHLLPPDSYKTAHTHINYKNRKKRTMGYLQKFNIQANSGFLVSTITLTYLPLELDVCKPCSFKVCKLQMQIRLQFEILVICVHVLQKL